MAANYNPFDSDASPFADPSVLSVTRNTANGAKEFNPFDDQNTSQAAVVQSDKERATSVVEEGQENLKTRQQELESKVAELQRREQELQRMQFGGYRENNFPPLPAKCPCKPCFFNVISIDIPIDYQKTCRALYIRWQVFSFQMVYNFLTALALLVDHDEPVSEGQNFGIAILYLLWNVPVSFIGWYRPAYNALKNDGSFCFVVFLINYFWHILINFFYALGVTGSGACGFINGTEAFHRSVPVGSMMFASGTMFFIGAIVDTVLLVKVHRIYRMAGASFQKAQDEFARGVAFNPYVRGAAAGAVAGGIHQTIQRQ